MGWKEDLNYGLAAFGLRLPEAVPLDDWAARLAKAPCQNTVALVAASSLLFYAAERGHNPKVRDVWDALVYCSTCLSVGYGDVFAQTPAGKILGSALMTMGPALSGRTLDGPAGDAVGGRRDAIQTEILKTLQQILLTLEAQNAGQPPTPPERSE